MKIKFFLLGAIASFCLFYIIFACNPKVDTHLNDSFKEKLITYQQGKILYDNYTNSNYKVINATRPEDMPDSRAYWYSLEDLEGYINYVKTEGAAKGYKNLGIRIYMGEYPENGGFDPRQDPKYNGYQTVYLIPTQNNSETEKSVQKLVQARSEDPDGNEDITDLSGMDLSSLSPPN